MAKFTFKKIVIFSLVFCFLLSEGGFPYNINKGVFAQEKERATICEEGKEIDLPYITEKDETPLRENTLEAPIGRAVDEIEAVSEMIIRTLPALINAADQEAQAAKRMSDLAIKCGKDPYICESDCICQFVGYEDCGCSSGSVPGKENCGDTSLCPGGTCPSDEYRNGECGAYWKNPCPDEHCNNPPCPGNCYCDGGEPQSCYCKPVYRCTGCTCTCPTERVGWPGKTCPLCPPGATNCPDCPSSPGCPLPTGTSIPYPNCPNPNCPPTTCPTCPPGINTELATIQSQANIIKIAFGTIADPFFLRFKPITFYEMQYNKTKELGYYIDIPADLAQILGQVGWSWGTPLSGLDQVSKDFCEKVVSEEIDPWRNLCATPISIKVEDRLEKSRDVLKKCVVSESGEEGLYREEAGILSCQNVLDSGIPSYSFLEFSDPAKRCYYVEEGVPTRFCEGCYGQYYCEEENRGYCAEDYFCCQ